MRRTSSALRVLKNVSTVRILRAIVEATANFVTVGVADLFHRRGIRAKPVGDDAPRLAIFLHDALQKLERCGSRFAVTTVSKTSPS